MKDFHYSLLAKDYSWKNAFLWGNFVGHCKKANEGKAWNRFIHILIAASEFLPVIGQIASIFEKIIISNVDISNRPVLIKLSGVNAQNGVASISRPNGELVDVKVSIAGNPPHPGHVGMIAQGIKRLLQERYKIGQLFVHWDEEYLKAKVFYANESVRSHRKDGDKSEKFRVLLPKETRIKFVNYLIQEAKDRGQLEHNLKISFDESSHSKRNVFKIVGGDHSQNSEKYCVIVSRDSDTCENINEINTETTTLLKTCNVKETDSYSSSKIQDGNYELLPKSLQEEFRLLHEVAQKTELDKGS